MHANAASFGDPPPPQPEAGAAPAPCPDGDGVDGCVDAVDAVDPGLTVAASRLPPDPRGERRRASGAAVAGVASLVVHALLLGAAWSLAGGMQAAAPRRIVNGDPTGLALASVAGAPPESSATLSGAHSAAGKVTPPDARQLAGAVAGFVSDATTGAAPPEWASPLGAFAEAEAPSEPARIEELIGAGPTPLPQPRRARAAAATDPSARAAPGRPGSSPASVPPYSAPQQPQGGAVHEEATPADNATAVASRSAETASAEDGGTFVPPRPADGPGGRSRSGARGGRHRRLDGRGLPVPAYPSASKRMGESGLVLLEVQVLPDGTVGAVTVRSAPAYPRLVDAAVDAVRKARFDPATRNGRPVTATLSIPFRFVLL